MRTLLTLSFLLISTAAAQHPIEARVQVGTTSYVDENSNNHTTVGGAVRFYLTRRISIEPEYLFQRASAEHRDHVLWANVAVDLLARERKVVPYWFAGPGFIQTTTRFRGGSYSNKEMAGSTGLGVRFRITDRVFAGPQFRVGVADAFFGEVTGSIGFVLK